MTEIMSEKMIQSLSERLKEVNDIIGSCSCDTMPFEHANVIVRFYYDYQDTNVIIDEAETIATEDAGRLRVLAVMLKDETATLLNNIGRLDRINFREIANEHSKQYYFYENMSVKVSMSGIIITFASII